MSGPERPAVALATAVLVGLLASGCSGQGPESAATAPPSGGTDGTSSPIADDGSVEVLDTDARGLPFTYPKGDGLIRSRITSLPPGQEAPPAESRAPVFLHVLDGIVTITVEGDDVTTVVTGRSAVLPARTGYVLANRDGSTATFLTVQLGRQGAAATP